MEEQEREEHHINAVVNQHVAVIRQQVQRYWIRPSNNIDNLQSIIKVRLIPSGDVRDVTIVESSGNELFDRSAESAVYKAAPFTMPTEAKAAARLRSFKI